MGRHSGEEDTYRLLYVSVFLPLSLVFFFYTVDFYGKTVDYVNSYQ